MRGSLENRLETTKWLGSLKIALCTAAKKNIATTAKGLNLHHVCLEGLCWCQCYDSFLSDMAGTQNFLKSF